VWQQLRAELTEERQVRRFADVPTAAFPSFEDDLDWIIDRLRRASINSLIAVDLSIPGLGIAVVRIVIPGLEQQRMGTDYLPGLRAQSRIRHQKPPEPMKNR
jgi:ribosomal protein S12 methylthiotransferase accessory factor